MKKMLMRPTAALFPAALLLAALLGNRIAVFRLFLLYCMIQLLSLCSIDSFRNAAAREPGVRRVDRRFSGTWPVVAFGIAAAAAVCMVWGKKAADLPLVIAAGLVIIEHLFEERMFALGKTVDGVLQAVIGNILLAVGLILDAGGLTAPAEGFYAMCSAGLGAAIAVIVSYVTEPMRAFSLMPRNIAFFPRAALQSLLYPVLLIGTYFIVWKESGLEISSADYIALPAGMILWRLSRTVCRRSHDESRPLNLLAVAFAGAAVAAVCCCGALMPCMDACIVAMFCTVGVFCAPGWRIYAGAVLVTAGWFMRLKCMEPVWLAAIPCAVAVILNMHRAFLRKV